MKKKILLFLCLLLVPFTAKAENEFTYEEAQEVIRQSMQAWYMRGSYRQYNSSKNTYTILRHPEDSTVQDTGYSVCSGFSNDALMEAFGFKAGNDKVPYGNSPAGSSCYCTEAGFYLYGNPEVNYTGKGCKTLKPSSTGDPKEGCRGEYVVYYYSEASGNDPEREYYYNPNKKELSELKKLNNFLKLLQPGDIVSYDGHVLLVYDFKYKDGKRVDALLIESGTGGEKIYSKIDPTEVKLHQLYYHRTKMEDTNGILDIKSAYMPYEGTLHWRWFSAYKPFVNDGVVKCTKNLCSITRAYYKSGDNAVLNYDVEWPQQIKTSKARLELPGIFITKTSSKYDNNSVVLNDTITYTIRIVNNSNLSKINGTSKSKKYTSFHVEEVLPAEVDFVTATIDGSQEGNYNENTRTIKWDISSLEATKEIVLKYKVKVHNDTKNIGKFINAEGKVYKSNANNYIKTSTVRHEIINTTSATDEKYRTCYNSLKNDHSALSLIQLTYECVYGTDLPFDLTKFGPSGDDMLHKLITSTKENPSKTNVEIRLDTSGEKKIYADMILNSYWNMLVNTNHGKTDGSTYYLFPRWRNENKGSYIGDLNRANTIASGHFKAGDVLIYYEDKAKTKSSLRYTKENGLYVYIYLYDKNGENGKFVGVNHKDNSYKRNEFTPDYYKSNSLDYTTNLYNGASKTDSTYTYANYQTLFGKDAYVILRPEKVITEVKSITVKTNPTKTTYLQNQTLDITGGVITASLSDGTTEDVSMTDSGVKVTGYNAAQVGEQTLTVTYKGKSASFKVTVEALSVASIAVKTNPTKTTYFVGDTLSLTGGVIKATYNDNSTKELSMSNSAVSVTGFDSASAGTKTLTVTYQEKTTTFNVTVVEVAVTTISIEKYPTKLVYQVGEELDLTGGEIKKVYNNGLITNVDMTDASVTATGYNKDTPGTQTITLTTVGKTLSIEVIVNTVEDPAETRTLDSISIYSTPNKLSYNVGESLDVTGGKIKAKIYKTMGENTEIAYEVINMSDASVQVSGFSSAEVGEKTVTVTYQEKTTSFTVVVSKPEAQIESIEVTTIPTKHRYLQYQEELNVAGGILTVTKTDNTTQELPLTDSEVTILDFDNSILGEQQVHVIYKGLETTFPVTVYANGEASEEEDETGEVTKVEIIQQPEITTYTEGDNFDVSGIILRLTYDDGDIRNVELADYLGQYSVSGFDNKKVGEQTVTIHFRGQDVQVQVNVVPRDAIPSPDTLARKGFVSKIIAVLLLVSGFVIFIKNTQKKNS